MSITGVYPGYVQIALDDLYWYSVHLAHAPDPQGPWFEVNQYITSGSWVYFGEEDYDKRFFRLHWLWRSPDPD